jgi:hypothetical protein
MAESEKTPDAPQTVMCPACGAQVLASTRFCGDCGAEIIPPSAVMDSSLPPAPLASAEPSAEPIEDGKLCNWCRTMSPRDAISCVNCGAVFPTPAGDEALERAARARIQDLNEDIQKIRNKTWWPFRGR